MAKAVSTESYGENPIAESKDKNGASKQILKYKSEVLFDIETGVWFAYGIAFMDDDDNDVIVVGGEKIGVFSNDGIHKRWITCESLKFAYDVKVKDQLIYISDMAKKHRKILVFDPEGIVQRLISMPKCEQKYDCFSLGLAFDVDDNLFIGSFQTIIVYKCLPQSTTPEPFLTQATNPDLNEPLYLCVTPKQELIVSTYSSNNIQAYDMKGELLWKYDGKNIGDGDMKFLGPNGLCSDKEGNVYVCDHYSYRIQIVNGGNLIGYIQLQNSRNPQALIVNSNQELFIVTPTSSRILKVKF